MSAPLNYLRQCLQWVFPERDDHKVVRELDIKDLWVHLQPRTDGRLVTLLPFSAPGVRSLIHEAKFHQNERAFRLLGTVLERYLKSVEAGAVIIPVPLSAKRRKERGCNQVEEVVKRALRDLDHVRMSADALYRARDTKPQTSLSRRDRLNNVAGAFAVCEANLRDVRVILVDDVATTGATLKAAAAALETLSPASVTLLALAR